jgi:hypothetical protein
VPPYRDHTEYWASLAPRLDAYIAQRRRPEFESALVRALAFYSFVTEDLPSKVRRRGNLLPKISTLFLIQQDVLRGLVPATVELSLVTVGALARIAFEARVTMKFIGLDPEKWADRYARFGEVQRLLREQFRPPGVPPLHSEERLEQIRRECPEWITKKGAVLTNWTADHNFRSLNQIAAAVGMQEDYLSVYGVNSNFVHGSALAANLYAGPAGLNAVGSPERCRSLAFLAAIHALKSLREACGVFDVEFNEAHYYGCHEELLAAVGDLLKDMPEKT